MHSDTEICASVGNPVVSPSWTSPGKPLRRRPSTFTFKLPAFLLSICGLFAALFCFSIAASAQTPPQIKQIMVTGEGPIPAPEVLKLLQTKVGQVFDTAVYAEDIKRMEKYYKDKGFIATVGSGDGPTNGVMALQIVVARIGAVRITGLQEVSEKWVRQTIKQKTGDYFNRIELDKSIATLNENRTIDSVTYPEPGPTAGPIDITVNVKETALINVTTTDPAEAIRHQYPNRPELIPQIGHQVTIMSLAYTHDGKSLFSADASGSINMWDVSSGDKRRALATPQMAMTPGLSVSSDGKTLACSMLQGIAIWNTGTGKLLQVLNGSMVVSPFMQATAFSPRGNLLAIAGYVQRSDQAESTAILWDVRNSRISKQFRGAPGMLMSVALSMDGKTIAAAGMGVSDQGTGTTPEGDVTVWDVESGSVRKSFTKLGQMVKYISIAPDGSKVATIDNHNTLRICDLNTGQSRLFPARRPMNSSARSANGANEKDYSINFNPLQDWLLAFAPNSPLLAVKTEAEIQFIDTQSGKVSNTVIKTPGDVSSLTFSPNGEDIALGYIDPGSNKVSLASANVKTARISRFRVSGGNALSAGAWVRASQDGRILISTDMDSLSIWSAATGRLQRKLTGYQGEFGGYAVAPNGQVAVAIFTEGTRRKVKLFDTTTGAILSVLASAGNEPVSVAFSPGGKEIAVGVQDGAITKTSGEVRFLEVGTGRLERTVVHLGGKPIYVLYSGSGNRVAVYVQPGKDSLDREVKILDPARATPAHTIASYEFPVTDSLIVHCRFAFLPDGKHILLRAPYGLEIRDTENGAKSQPDDYLRLGGLEGTPISFALAADGKRICIGTIEGKLFVWPNQPDSSFTTSPFGTPATSAAFIREGAQIVSTGFLDSSLRVFDSVSGKLVATFVPLLQGDAGNGGSGTTALTPRPIEVASKAAARNSDDWFVYTPEGYFDCSANAASVVRWNVNGVLVSGERYLRRFRRPDLVRRALAGEKITEPEAGINYLPPTAVFSNLKSGQAVSGESLNVPIEIHSNQEIKDVEITVNGRPLPPERARPIEMPAKSINSDFAEKTGPYRLVNHFKYRIPLSLVKGTSFIRIRAIAYDDSGLASDPVEIVLKHANVLPVHGHLFVLTVGVSKYKHSDGNGFKDLAFPAVDAKAIADRFRVESGSLYDHVEVKYLHDVEADLEGVRRGLKWLHESVRPGQVDTAVVYLSGHGFTDETDDLKYYFATNDFDPAQPKQTGLSGLELRNSLGGALQAKNVFLFVDTCHSGGLRCRNEDLRFDVKDNVYILASSSATGYSYEGPNWKHGAFTLALLRALNRKDIAEDGVIQFNDLTYDVPKEMRVLMKEAGQEQKDQEPCVPSEILNLTEPLLSAPAK